MNRPRRTGALRRRDFVLLLTGQSVSQVGTAVTYVALPAVAVIMLHASPAQVGLLEAMQFAAWPVLGFVAGAAVDRLPRRRVLRVGDAVRFIALATIPVLSWAGVLDLAALIVVAAVTGAATVFFEVAYYTYVPAIVAEDELLDANAKLTLSSSGAEVTGPMLGGGLVAAVGGATAILADAVSYLASLVSLWLLDEPDAPGVREPERTSLRAESVSGVSVVLRDPVLRAIAFATAAGTLGSSIVSVMYFIFAYRDLHLSPGLLGAILGGGNVALLVGSAMARNASARLGTRLSLLVFFTLANGGMALCCLARLIPAGVAFAAGAVVVGLTLPIFNVTQVTLRQERSPRSHLARVNATMKTMAWGMRPAGAAIGGVLGGATGSVATILAGTAVGASGALALGWTLRPRRASSPAVLQPAEERASQTIQA